MTEYYKTEETKRLTEQYPVDEVLGACKDFWTSDKLTKVDAALFFSRKSPVLNFKRDVFLAGLVAAAARKGEWLGYDSEWSLKGLEDFEVAKTSGRLSSFGVGLVESIESNLLDFEVSEGKVYFVPKEGLVKLTQEKVEIYLDRFPK